MTLTRRAALRLGGGLGLGGLLAGGTAKTVPSLIPAGIPNNGVPTVACDGSSRAWDLFSNLECNHILWRHLQDSHIDPDLRGMRSLSPTIRLIIQRQRDAERRGKLSQIRKILGLR